MPAEIGFVKLQRSEWARDLMRDPFAFHLLAVVAMRARFTDEPNLDGLSFGQALVGDWTEIGLTRGQAREAMKRLTKWNLARFEGTPRGTLATLLDSRVFSLRDERQNAKRSHPNSQLSLEEKITARSQSDDHDTAGSHPRYTHFTTTNQNGQKEEGKNGENRSLAPAPADACMVRNELFDALAKSGGEGDPTKLTRPTAKAVGVALANIKRVCPEVTVEEIQRRAANYRTHFPDPTVTLSAHALAKHWARVAEPALGLSAGVIHGRKSSFA